MRILVLSNLYPPHAYGGYELACADVVERWRAQGHDVLVLTSDVRLEGVDETPGPGPEVRRDLRLFWEDHVVLNPSLPERMRMWRHNRGALDGAVEEFQPEVASAWAMGAMSMGLLARLAEHTVPVVSVVADEWPVYGPRLDAWARPFTTRPRLGRVVQLATGLGTSVPDLDRVGPTCFASEAMRVKIRSLSPWKFPFSGVVPWGIDERIFVPAPGAGARPWRWKLVHVGRIDERKGIATVIEALARCPEEATLEIVGRGDESYRRTLEARCRELGLERRVAFSECPRAALAARYQEADALVFAPLWDEPFGLVPIEAMGCGTPVVASPTGGSAEFLEDGVNCLTFPAGDAGALADRLQRLADDAPVRAALVSGGSDTAAHYTVERMTRELEQWHRRAVTGARVPSE